MKKRRKKKKGAKGSAPAPTPEIPPFVRLLVETPAATLDLHGMTAVQAERRLSGFIRTQSTLSPGKVVHVVTGRGVRSTGAPVLPGVAQDLLRSELDEFVKEIGGLPGGGALAVRLAG